MYRRLPYALRFLIALALWPAVVAGDLLVRACLLAALPFIVIKSGFGLAHSRFTAQANIDAAEFLTRPFLKMPRAHRQSLLGHRGGSGPDKARPLEEIGNRRI